MSTVLIVEDDPTVARLVQMTLEFGDLEVRVVGTASDARDLLAEGWDAFVLDINLPGTSGLQVRRRAGQWGSMRRAGTPEVAEL